MLSCIFAQFLEKMARSMHSAGVRNEFTGWSLNLRKRPSLERPVVAEYTVNVWVGRSYVAMLLSCTQTLAGRV